MGEGEKRRGEERGGEGQRRGKQGEEAVQGVSPKYMTNASLELRNS